ncbi:MAG: hypothetical protein KGI08_03295 [Thaumarchaeota archaeon]|nr:hypothetical protein [Nitrososphaerota archaeon]
MDLNNLTPTQQVVHRLFKDRNGESRLMTPGQDYIFKNIFGRIHNRLHIMCFTRYGKSDTVGPAVLLRAATFPEKWSIIAGQKEKAKIIMDYIIEHIFDNDYMKDRYIPDKGESWESIRRHRNKNRLTFATDQTKDGKTLLSEIFIGSAKDALGFGAKNVVADESALIPDDQWALVMRMLGDDPHDNFMAKIGNPFTRGHFLDSYRDPKYRKIVIDCYRGLQEGRITQDTIDEMKELAFFPVLYECKFPSANEIDEQGYMQLLVENDIQVAQTRVVEPAGIPRLGLDVAKGGRNFNCWVLRLDNVARVIDKNHEENSVTIAEQTMKIMDREHINPHAVFIDDTGVGHGVVSVLKSRGLPVNAVNNGDAARKSDQFINVRAESYAGEYGVMTWIKQGGRLDPSKEWLELTRIRYKKDIGGRTKIESKEDMIKRGVQSPDVADALALTFAKQKINVYTNNNLSPKQVAEGLQDRPFGGVAPLIPGLIA